MITYKEFSTDHFNDIKEILIDAQWNAYLKDDVKLRTAFDQSLYCYGAFDNDKLVGYVRCVGDGVHVVVVQDLVVLSSYQKQRIGTTLFTQVLEKYSDVRMIQLITDIEDQVDNHFYQSFHFIPIEEGNMISYYLPRKNN